MNNIMTVDIDPTGAFKGIKESKLLAACGLLPHFALDVALSTPESVQEAFDMLMDCYQYGMGQDGTGWGTVDEKGMYISEHDEDPDMAPMIAFGLTSDITFYVYQYAICAVTDGETTLMMRMD
jgi:hypothetical protein